MKKPRNLSAALATLGDLKTLLAFYDIGTDNEPAEVPGAIVVDSDKLNGLKIVLDTANLVSANAFKFICTSKWGWASDSDPYEAHLKCKRETPTGCKTGKIKTYLCHPETTVSGDGSWTYPGWCAPRELGGAK